jgi:hypothetical protein
MDREAAARPEFRFVRAAQLGDAELAGVGLVVLDAGGSDGAVSGDGDGDGVAGRDGIPVLRLVAADA